MFFLAREVVRSQLPRTDHRLVLAWVQGWPQELKLELGMGGRAMRRRSMVPTLAGWSKPTAPMTIAASTKPLSDPRHSHAFRRYPVQSSVVRHQIIGWPSQRGRHTESVRRPQPIQRAHSGCLDGDWFGNGQVGDLQTCQTASNLADFSSVEAGVNRCQKFRDNQDRSARKTI